MDGQPTDEERRAAVCAALAHAPGLMRYAARFSRTLQDAEDAYQRALEIALTRAPVTEHERFMAWLRTVLRNEAMAIAVRHGREAPGPVEDVARSEDRRQAPAGDPAALTEWRHRYHALGDALADITAAQRVCLILQAGGASYAAIAEATGFSRRKVERSILEGRAALSAWEERSLVGETCTRLAPVLLRVAEGAADRRDRWRVARHVRHCGACRARLRDRRRTDERLGLLAPAALLAAGAQTAPPDPGPALAWFDRLSAAATVRVGNVLQVAVEAPGALAAKVGAAAAAAVVAAGAAIPAVAGLVDGDDQVIPAVAVADAARTPPVAVVDATGPARARPDRHPTGPATDPEPAPPRPVAPRRLVPVSALRHLPQPRRSGVPVRRAAASVATPVAASPSRSAAAPPAPAGRGARPGPAPDVAGPRGISIGPGSP